MSVKRRGNESYDDDITLVGVERSLRALPLIWDWFDPGR